MKTAYDIAKKHDATFSGGLVTMNQHDLMSAMHEYASQAIDKCAEEAKVKFIVFTPEEILNSVNVLENYVVDRDSILKVKELLK